MAGEVLEGKKIKELLEAASLDGTEDVVIEDQTPKTKRTTLEKILGWVISKLKVANNLTTNIEGWILDARQGKALNDKVDELNTKVNIKREMLEFEPIPGIDNHSYYTTLCGIAIIYLNIKVTGTVPEGTQLNIKNNIPMGIMDIYTTATSGLNYYDFTLVRNNASKYITPKIQLNPTDWFRCTFAYICQ